MLQLPTLHPELRWARFVHPDLPVGPWFATEDEMLSPSRRDKHLVFGRPLIGDMVAPYGKSAERYGEVSP